MQFCHMYTIGSDVQRLNLPKDTTLKKQWVKLLKTRGLCNPGSNHKVCSAHFQGRKKTYKNNIPTILAASTYQRSRRTLVIHDDILQSSSSDDAVTEYSNPELCPAILNEESIKEKKNDDDMKTMEQCLFRMERFIGSDTYFRLYTGFTDYFTCKAFFNYLSPACNHLIYRGSTTRPINSNTQIK